MERLRRIFPDHELTSPEEATSGLAFGALAPADRPYLVLNMIATADGAAALGGRTRALGDRTDRAVFHGLRTQVDCVMVGAGTARIERYGRIVPDAGRRERRRRQDLAPDPLACIVSGRLDIPDDLPLLQDERSTVIVVTAAEAALPAPAAATVEYIRDVEPTGGRPRLAPALRRLRTEHGVRSVLCEGGPTLNRSLLGEGLVDELFLTVAPKLVAGEPEITIVRGAPLAEPLEVELSSCHEAEGSLYLRYRVLG